MAQIVVSHLLEIEEEKVQEAEKRIKRVSQKLGVVVLKETRFILEGTDIGNAKYAKLLLWNGKEWEELLVWVEGEGWTYGLIGKEFMEDLGLTGVWAYYEEFSVGEEKRVRLFKNGEVYYGYTSNWEGKDYYDFQNEREISKEVFEKELKQLLNKAGFLL